MKNTSRLFLVLLLLVAGSMQPCRAELSAMQIESAYVFNFIKFVEWPASTIKSSDKIRLCVIGNDELLASLSTLDGRKIGERRLQILPRADDDNDLKICQVLYIGTDSQRRLVPIIKSLGDAPVLTISDIADFAQRGGSIGLLYRDDKVLFEVNLASARKAGLRLSSQMLNLAANIFGR